MSSNELSLELQPLCTLPALLRWPILAPLPIKTARSEGDPMTRKFVLLATLAAVGVGISGTAQAQGAASAQQANMTFFVTSAGKGNGADLGGLEGADAHCAALAKAAGAKATNWRAYLSTTLPGGDAGTDARSRIGKGPWQNAKGVVVAKSVSDLHSEHNNLNKQTALNEKGEMVKARGDTPTQHDILTGSDPDGRFSDR